MKNRFAEVIGCPIKQSKSPMIHGFWIDKLGLDVRYGAHLVEDDPAAVDAYFRSKLTDADWVGCNVTMPHKQNVISMLSHLDPVAHRIGAVNTVVRDGQDLVGYNTDADGFLEPLIPTLNQPHLFRMARILGTGGAARAIITALADKGFTLVVAGRDPSKARALLEELAPDGDHHGIDIAHFGEPTDFAFDDRKGCLDLVVNASPLGMRGSAPLNFDLSHAPPGSIFYDIVTSPIETQLLKSAAAAGHHTIGGFAMLIGQAAVAFEKFFKVPPPREYDAELMELLKK